jgi:hypothetical protein
MRFRGGDLLARIRASVLRRPHATGERRGTGFTGWEKSVSPPAPDSRPAGLPPVRRQAQITYYGRLGEMGHPDDRAADWPGADTGQVQAVRPPVR